MYFEKYHGTGNDFILIKDEVTNPSDVALKVCNRHFGIGADGLMYPSKSSIADIKMNYYNADGSVAKMCGNGIRCFARFVYEKNLENKTHFLVETLDGVKEVTLTNDEVTVKLNLPNLINHDMLTKTVDGKKTFYFDDIKGYIVSVGTMHAVIYLDENKDIDVEKYASEIQNHEIFKDQCNVNFVSVLNDEKIFVKTYERGSGWTLSCGTGATASAYHAYIHQKVNKSEVSVDVLGGSLKIKLEDNHCYLIGPAVKIASGEIL